MIKRFTIDKDGITVIDNYTDGLTECKYSQEAKLLCNFLNEITEENEQLKSDVYDWKASAEDYLKLGKSLKEENEQLKQVLGSILIEVRRDISATNHSGEVRAFVNPNDFDLISDILKKYGALKDWYE